jgi:hypothetical protein
VIVVPVNPPSLVKSLLFSFSSAVVVEPFKGGKGLAEAEEELFVE